MEEQIYLTRCRKVYGVDVRLWCRFWTTCESQIIIAEKYGGRSSRVMIRARSLVLLLETEFVPQDVGSDQTQTRRWVVLFITNPASLAAALPVVDVRGSGDEKMSLVIGAWQEPSIAILKGELQQWRRARMLLLDAASGQDAQSRIS